MNYSVLNALTYRGLITVIFRVRLPWLYMMIHHFKEAEPAVLKLNLLPLNFATSLPIVVVNSDSLHSQLALYLILLWMQIKIVSPPSTDLTR